MIDNSEYIAEQEIRKLHAQTGEKYKTEICRSFSDKKEASEYKNKLINRFKAFFGKDKLPGNYED